MIRQETPCKDDGMRHRSRAPQARGYWTMATITAGMVKDLREKTGAGMIDF